MCERERKREIERANWRGRERFGDPDESRDYLFLWGSEREGGRDRQQHYTPTVLSELRRSNASLTNEPFTLTVFKVWISSSIPCVLCAIPSR